MNILLDEYIPVSYPLLLLQETPKLAKVTEETIEPEETKETKVEEDARVGGVVLPHRVEFQ